MADVGLVFTTVKGKVGTIDLSATLSEGHSRTADVTEYPVEKGSDVADHVRPKPAVLKMEAVVTGQKSVGDAWAALEKLLDDGNPITVVTAMKKYDNMALISLDAARESRLGGALKFSATFRTIVLVSSKTKTVAVPRAKPPEVKNKGSPTPAPPLRTPLDEIAHAADDFISKWQEKR